VETGNPASSGQRFRDKLIGGKPEHMRWTSLRPTHAAHSQSPATRLHSAISALSASSAGIHPSPKTQPDLEQCPRRSPLAAGSTQQGQSQAHLNERRIGARELLPVTTQIAVECASEIEERNE
jgi:hypothetical protein